MEKGNLYRKSYPSIIPIPEIQVPKKDYVEAFKPSVAKKMASRAKIVEKLNQQKKEDELKKKEAQKLEEPFSAFGDINAMLASLMETKTGVRVRGGDDTRMFKVQ